MFIEGAPFRAGWEKLPCLKKNETSDSVVGKITAPGGTEWVIKWPRKRMFSHKDGWAACLYLKNAYQLYLKALGGEYIVPSWFVLGKKENGRGTEYKPYIIQPFVVSWTAKNAPEEIKQNPEIIEQWQILYHRLSRLYITAHEINHNFTNPQNRFPIALTVGSTRRLALEQGDLIPCQELPPTPNILITRQQRPHILLPDFGPYLPWQEEKKEAFEQIWKSFD